MKLIGHAWVAVNAVKGNRKLLILGSLLPEIMYYTQNHPFKWEEIHEGGEKVYKYLLENKQDWADLGLGMATHSIEKGADKFNLDENLAILGYSEKMIDKLGVRLSSILGVSYKAGRVRVHSTLELAVELGIMRDCPDFISEFKKVVIDKKTREEIKNILAKCFKKPKKEVGRVVDELFEKMKPEYFSNAKGLACLWEELSSAIPDPKPNIDKLAKLLEELSARFSGKDKEFLDKSISWTRSNTESLVKERSNNFETI